MRKLHWLISLAVVTRGLGCGSVERPQLCAFRAADFADPTSVTLDDCRAAPLQVNDGDVVYALHTLPDEVNIDDKLTVTVATPLEHQSFEHEHADHKVLFAFAAPKGAGCSLEITATIANEQARVVSIPVDTTACLGAGEGGAGSSADLASD
jgi:hypothetical protein